MNTRLLAGVVAASAALLTACGSSDSSTTPPTRARPPSGATSGTVRISGQNFTEAEIVADMYAAVLQKAGYTPQVNLVGTRDVYMKIFPKSSTSCPEYIGGILEFLNGTYNGTNAKPITVSDPQKSIDEAKPLLTRPGITLLNPSTATDTNAFFVTKKYADSNNVSHALRPQGQVGRPGRGARLQGPPRLRGRAVIDSTASTSPRSCRWATPASRPTTRCSRASRSWARRARPTARSRARAWSC